MSPTGLPAESGTEEVRLRFEEYEAIRLIDHDGLTQAGAAERMGISRPTCTRIYNRARKLLARALVEARPLSIGGGYSVLAFTFSGLTFPIMAMWEPMQWVSRIFPFTFYTDLFVDQMLRGTPWVYSLPDLCWMSLFIVLPLLCLPRLKRVATEEKFWGRL